MPHKMITDRQKVDEALVAAIHRHRDSVLTGLVERLRPWLPPETDVTAFAALYDTLPGLIETERDRLVASSREVLAERIEDRDPRERRDEAKLVLRTTLMELWRAAVALLGESAGQGLVKMDRAPVLDPQRILEQGEVMLAELGRPDLEVPPAIVPGIELDLAPWIAKLETQVDELRDAIDEVVRDRQDTAALSARKAAARLAHDRVLVDVGRYLVGLFHLADRRDEASLVRRAVRQRATRSDVGELEDTAETAPDGGPDEEPEASDGSEEEDGPSSIPAASGRSSPQTVPDPPPFPGAGSGASDGGAFRTS